MLLRIGGPYNGYRNGEVIELDDDEGLKLYESLGGEPRISMLGDLRDDTTKAELYERAQELEIDGRSDMTKDELAAAIATEEAVAANED